MVLPVAPIALQICINLTKIYHKGERKATFVSCIIKAKLPLLYVILCVNTEKDDRVTVMLMR